MPDIEGYFARVDAELATRTPVGRAQFLNTLTEQWLERYRGFQARVDRGAPIPAGLTCFDYLETISGLDQRTAALEAA